MEAHGDRDAIERGLYFRGRRGGPPHAALTSGTGTVVFFTIMADRTTRYGGMPQPDARLELVVGAFLLLSIGSCDFPRDPEHTLETVRGGELVAGVSEAPPWITKDGAGEPGGIEAALIRRLAASLDADIRWVWGIPAEHVEALARFELHVAAGGHTRRSPLARDVGTTEPWFVSAERRDETRLVEHRHVFLVPPGENAWIMWIEKRLRADSLFIESEADRAGLQ